eukprot:534329_1
MGSAASKIKTINAKQSADKKQHIKISIRMNSLQMPDSTASNYNLGVIEVIALYSPKELIKDILISALQHVRKKHYPIRFEVDQFDNMSFIFESQKNGDYITDILMNAETINTPITAWNKETINTGYLDLDLQIHYVHKIESVNITCDYMKNVDSTDPLKCPIYCKMATSYEWNEINLKHMTEFEHFKCEFSEKKECKFSDECYAYKRLEEGGNDVKDLCHLKIFRHPPRNRSIKLQKNIHSFVVQTEKNPESQKVYTPTNDDKKEYDYSDTNGYLNALIEEVIANGFKSDLCLNDDDEKNNNYSILSIVDQKINCIRHKAMGGLLNRAQMLSLILYTGCDCNYDLCSSQRNGDYLKWKWFDYCLFHAISRCSKWESGDFAVYSGLNNVKLATKCKKFCFFATYVSASWNKNVAQSFMKDNGMIIEIDSSFKENDWVQCCDVSWISKFSDECEILFQRGGDIYEKSFRCNVVDESNGIQTVALTNNDGLNPKSTVFSHLYL